MVETECANESWSAWSSLRMEKCVCACVRERERNGRTLTGQSTEEDESIFMAFLDLGIF